MSRNHSSILNLNQKEKTIPILREIEEAEDISINENGMLEVGNRLTLINATSLVYDLQSNKKQLPDPNYKQILDKLSLTPHFVANSAAKRMTKPTTKTKVVTGKPKTSKRTFKRPRIPNEWQFVEDTTEEEGEKGWDYLDS